MLVLDPACGTGTFLYKIVDQIRARFMKTGSAGLWSAYVREQLLPRLFGFELLMAPYAVAHLKLGLQLAGHDLSEAQRRIWGYDFEGDERVQVFLTNTLDEAERRSQFEFGFSRTLTEEANAAVEIKSELPIMVVIGNPPYSNFGRQNRGPWILDQLKDYKKGLQEKKLNLDNDFIKFVRFGQWRITQTGAGILALITDNTYLDGLTHRRMRESLKDCFSEIYILDLHGNSRKKERAPDGSKDENVFDIQQGVAIGIFVKKPGVSRPAVVRHAEMWGAREAKYQRLAELDVSTTQWQELTPSAKHFYFVPKAFRHKDEYLSSRSVRDIFPISQNGIKTDRDTLFLDFDEDALRLRMRTFYSEGGLEPDFVAEYRVENSSSYDLLRRRTKTSFTDEGLYRFLYRPFDERWIYYSPGLTSRPAWDVMRHLLADDNLALITTRQTSDQWDSLVGRHLIGHKSCAAHDINTVFPLYLYPSAGSDPVGGAQAQLLAASPWPAGRDGRRPNLDPLFVDEMKARLRMSFVSDGSGSSNKAFGPDDILHFAYAVFHSPGYRERFDEFLRVDFARLPLTSNRELFRTLCATGSRLVALHLLEAKAAKQPTFPRAGSFVVEKVRYQEPTEGGEQGRVWMNAEQYFEGVSPEVWQHRVGGYQVCERWLEDRVDRKLGHSALVTYQTITANLAESLVLEKEIEAAMSTWFSM